MTALTVNEVMCQYQLKQWHNTNYKLLDLLKINCHHVANIQHSVDTLIQCEKMPNNSFVHTMSLMALLALLMQMFPKSKLKVPYWLCMNNQLCNKLSYP